LWQGLIGHPDAAAHECLARLGLDRPATLAERAYRALVSAALNGELHEAEFVTEPAFGLHIPVSCPDVPAEVLNPRNAWADKEAYDRQAADLASRFEENFKQFDASESVRAAGPGKR